jgi:ech hydrogenase subunit D
MNEKQDYINIGVNELLNKVSELKNSGYRLVQIGCTASLTPEINYSFDRDYHFINLKVNFASFDEGLPSISFLYGNAFLYENEIHDLFGVKFKNITVDYQGNFYRMSVKYPFRKNSNQQK